MDWEEMILARDEAYDWGRGNEIYEPCRDCPVRGVDTCDNRCRVYDEEDEW